MKFVQDVLQHESLTGQVTQIHCTADPTTHDFRKNVETQPTRGRGSTRPIQFHEDLSWEERSIHKQLGYAQVPHPPGDGHRPLADLHGQKSQIIESKTIHGGASGRRLLKFANAKYLHIMDKTQESMDAWTHSRNRASLTCSRKV